MTTQGRFCLLEQKEIVAWLNTRLVNREILRIQLHHTLKPSIKDFTGNDHFKWLQGMYNYHVNKRGFSDIAQHFTVFPDGTIGTGRSLNSNPAGIKGANRGSICIEVFGNFDHDEMTDMQKESTAKLTAALVEKFNIKVDTNGIIYHHWYDRTTGKRTNGTGDTKTCPGVKFFGGNSVESCESEFIPAVKKMLTP